MEDPRYIIRSMNHLKILIPVSLCLLAFCTTQPAQGWSNSGQGRIQAGNNANTFQSPAGEENKLHTLSVKNTAALPNWKPALSLKDPALSLPGLGVSYNLQQTDDPASNFIYNLYSRIISGETLEPDSGFFQQAQQSIYRGLDFSQQDKLKFITGLTKNISSYFGVSSPYSTALAANYLFGQNGIYSDVYEIADPRDAAAKDIILAVDIEGAVYYVDPKANSVLPQSSYLTADGQYLLSHENKGSLYYEPVPNSPWNGQSPLTLNNPASRNVLELSTSWTEKAGILQPNDERFKEWEKYIYANVDFKTSDKLFFINSLSGKIHENLIYNPAIAGLINEAAVSQGQNTSAMNKLNSMLESVQSDNANSVTAMALNNEGVCSTFAFIEHYMLGQNGIPSRIITFRDAGNTLYHAALEVDIQGNTYIADPTKGTLLAKEEYISRFYPAGISDYNIEGSLFSETN